MVEDQAEKKARLKAQIEELEAMIDELDMAVEEAQADSGWSTGN